ncbi:MAG: serine/threonine-protein kinase [Planctomycetota bacterium]
MQSLVQSHRPLLTPLPESDQLLLDEAFERALASWEEGLSISPADLLPGRPDLRDHAERVVALVQDVAVTGPAPLPMPIVPGYTLLSELGRGAMGAVYLARQDRLGGRSVALKVLPAGTAASARARDRFQAEANAIARLRHPHIVTVYDVVREGTLLAFAMEPVEGPTLHEVIDHLASLSHPPGAADVRAFSGAGTSALSEEPYWTFVARLGVAVARALQAVHDAGLLHRDVKPSNILLRRDGTPLLSDFGLVRDPGSGVVTREGFAGTPAYAPPEQLAGGPGAADVRSDVYALGATLYHALALRTPFAASTPVAMLQPAQLGAPPLIARSPGTPRDLVTIIAKAMSPAAKDRYATAAQLADDLDRLLSQRPILARPAGVLSRGVKLLRRNRQAFWGTIGGAIGVLVLVGGLMLSLVLMPRWAQNARERAWLSLLDPRDTQNFAVAGFWQQTSPGPPRFNVRLAQGALVEYERAAWLQPWEQRTELERDVLRAVISVGEDGRSPLQLSASLSRRAPGACEWLERWTQATPHDMPPPLPAGDVASDELIAIGLMSYLSAEMHPAVEAWLRLEQAGEPGPFVRGGLGLYFIYAQEPGRAYPRLQEADRAFGAVSFLRAAHAEAALGVGDVDLAAMLLEQARTLSRRDEGQITRLAAVLEFERGDLKEALTRFGEWYFTGEFGHNSVAGYQVAMRLAARGDEAHAVGILATAMGGAFPKPILRALLPMAERWWDGLSQTQRLDFALRAIATDGKPEPWGETCVPVMYWRARSRIAADPRFADLRGLLHPHPLAQCGERLDPYCRWNAPPGQASPPPPQGAELRKAARAALGLDVRTDR